MEQRCIHSFPRLMTYPLMGTAVSRDTEQQTFASLGSDDRNGSFPADLFLMHGL